MGSTQTWAIGLSIYFVFLFIIVALFTAANHLPEEFITSGVYDFATEDFQFNETDVPSTSPFNWGQYLKDLFSFFAWDIGFFDAHLTHDRDTIHHMVLMQYFWILRIFIVYLPLLALILTIWYSVPTVSG